jgi:HK97 family phage prohead protease
MAKNLNPKANATRFRDPYPIIPGKSADNAGALLITFKKKVSMEKRTAFAELRATKGNTIVGKIPYESLSEDMGYFEKLMPGCFTSAISKAKNIYSLWSHDNSKPLGNTTAGTLELRDTLSGLEVTIKPDTNVSWGQDALRAVKRGDVRGLSFGFTMSNGEVWNNDIREIHEIESLLEISPVVFPAYSESSVSVRNKGDKKMSETIVEMKARVEREKRWLNDHDDEGNLKGGNMTPIDTKKSNIEMGSYRPAEKPWESRGHFLNAVASAGRPGGQHDPRLYRATGLGEGVPSDGGFLVDQDFSKDMISHIWKKSLSWMPLFEWRCVSLTTAFW